jgi:hypothetical protein
MNPGLTDANNPASISKLVWLAFGAGGEKLRAVLAELFTKQGRSGKGHDFCGWGNAESE